MPMRPLAGDVDKLPVLVASSNEHFREQLVRLLSCGNWSAEAACGGADALIKLEQAPCKALLVDGQLHDLDVQEVIALVSERHPEVGVLLIDPRTGQARPAPSLAVSPVSAMLMEALSASQAFPAPPPVVETAEWSRPPAGCGQVAPAAEEVERAVVEPLPGMVGQSGKLARVYKLARLIAARDCTVLLTGETGTGKEIVARAIHQLSARGKRPFIVVNCAAIPETLLEAELFGYTRGAFTGAFQNRIGRIHSAHGGTLLLDEVGELPPSMQVKLLRFLQEGEVQRLGSSDVFRVDVRVIAATNADLLRRISERAFRQDLYYRVAVFPIEMPPLRDHPEDIAVLAQHHLELLAQTGEPQKRLSAAAIGLLVGHSWPGNVRELQHVVERALILSEDDETLLPEHFPTLPAGRG
jgi:DNA-binding NtrC family response regulator